MAVRRESVRLSLEDAGYSTGMAKATVLTLALDDALDKLDGSNVRVQRSTSQTGQDVERLSDAAVRGSSSIDQYSGRLRILAEAIATLGPGLLAIGAGGLTATAALAGLFGGVTVGALAMVGAVQGVGDALKAVEEARLDPTVENIRKAQEAMAKLGPDAREFVARFQEIRPILKALRDEGAAGLFPGLTDSLDSLEKLEPVLTRLMAGAGQAGGDAIAASAESLASERWEPFLDFLVDEIPQAIDNTTRLLGSLAHAGAEIWQVFDPTNDNFIEWLNEAAEGFDRWSSSADGREDLRAFLDYVQQNGPKVGDFIGAIADALTQVFQAAAPLSGPVLDTLTNVSKVIATIADSDLGTPILGGVAALTLYTRSLQVAATLQSKLFGSNAAKNFASQGAFAYTRTMANDSVTGLKKVGTELRGVGANWRYLGTSAAYAEARQSRALAGMAKGAVIVGGLSLAATGAADAVGLTNTSSLALMGTLAGPWGAAVGGAVGLTMDIVSANSNWAESMRQVDGAIAAGDIDAMNSKLVELRSALEDIQNVDGFGDAIGDGVSGLGEAFSWAGALVTGGDWESQGAQAQAAIERLESSIASTEEANDRAQLAQLGLSDALQETGRSAVGTSADLIELAGSTEKSSTAAWNAFDAQTRLGSSLDDVAAAARKGRRGLDDATEGGRENRTVLSGLAGDWAETKAAMEANGASAKSIERRYREVRSRLIDAATAMTGSRAAAVRLANQLAKPMSIIIKERHQEAISSAKAAIAELRRAIEGNPITQRVVTVNVGGKPTKATVGTPGGLGDLLGGGRAEGGYTGDGGKYDPAGIVHRGEVVIPQEDVARDRDFLKYRYGHLPGMDQLHTGGLAGYAAGGRVGALAFAGLPALDLAAMSAKELASALRESQRVLTKETKEREALLDKIAEAKSTVVSNLRSDPFADATSLAEATGVLRGDIVRTEAFNADRAALIRNGLRGDALTAVLTSGNETLIEDAAGSTRAQLAQFQATFGRRQSVTDRAAAALGSAMRVGSDVAAVGQLKQLNKRVDRLSSVLERRHKESQKARRRGASQAAQRKHRGKL